MSNSLMFDDTRPDKTKRYISSVLRRILGRAAGRARPATPWNGGRPDQDRRPRLAIVSTYDDLCGIAGYTRAIEKQLRSHVDLTVFDLDQYFLRGFNRHVQARGDCHIKEIASHLPEFDSVNIQLEHGTLGQSPYKVLQRFGTLARSARALSVTFHTVIGNDPVPWDFVSRCVLRGRLRAAIEAVGNSIRSRILSYGIYGLLRRLQKHRPVSLIVHTKRDARLLRYVFRLKNVYHHPLSFISPEDAAATRASASRDTFPVLRTLSPDAKLIGTFGFLSPYKGFETVIQAMRYLPEDHHLLIFGGVHPQSIKREMPLDPYVHRLLRRGRIGQTALEHMHEIGASVTTSSEPASLLGEHPNSLHRRLHFMGALPDARFTEAMAICNAVVLPYLEVGQSSSGPISLALEMGARVIASRTLAFLQFAKYHPNQIEFFDIGNYAELADILRSESPFDVANRRLDLNTSSNVALYLQANFLATPWASEAIAGIDTLPTEGKLAHV